MTGAIIGVQTRRVTLAPGRRAVRRLVHNRRALLGLALVGLVVLLALVSFVWTPYPANQINVAAAHLSPRPTHLAGTDELGRDVFSRVMAGSRTSLAIAAMAVFLALIGGSVLGFITGYVGGAVDLVISRVNDMLLAIPALAIALGVVAIMGPSGVSVAISLGAAYTPTFTRIIRSSVVAVRSQPFVEASTGLASSTLAIAIKDVLPNVMPVITVQVTTSLAWGIMDEAALGFLGLGVQPPTPSWGSLLSEGRNYLYQVPWLPVAAGVAVLIAVLGVNLLGDGLRDILDPRTAQ
jgi:peptide/nickel transport system permease protein